MTVVVAVAMLMMVPTTLASPTPHVVVLAAPYKGTTTGTSSSLSTSGCGSAVILQKAFFHPSTGVGGFGVRSTSPSCPANPLGASGYAAASFETNLPVPIASSSVSIVAVASVNAFVRAHITVGTCSPISANYTCYLGASSEIYAYVELIDETSGNYYFSANYWSGYFVSAFNETACYAGTCYYYSQLGASHHLAATPVWKFTEKGLNPKDHFVLSFYFSSYISSSQFTSAATMTGGSATALVDASSGSNGITLDSVTIT